MRQKKPTNGKVAGAKFTLNDEAEHSDLKAEKARILKELEEKEKNSQEWYDNEMEKNLKKQ